MLWYDEHAVALWLWFINGVIDNVAQLLNADDRKEDGIIIALRTGTYYLGIGQISLQVLTKHLIERIETSTADRATGRLIIKGKVGNLCISNRQLFMHAFMIEMIHLHKNGIDIIRGLEYNSIRKFGGVVMDYMSAREAADKWGISQRRVAVLCSENRIDNATMVGNMWIIPTTALKPIDARIVRFINTDEKKVRPFLKWAGGKGQLISAIEKYYPFENGVINKYAEPFVGGGAVLFDILSKFELEAVYISDINAELINTYRIIRDDIDELIDKLALMQNEFLPLNLEQRKLYYLKKRECFNNLKNNGNDSINSNKAALMIFLNKTCFNGLFRVNRKGFFNVPMGSYKNPMICDEENLRAVSDKLQNVTIVCGDYRESASFIDDRTFVYFDPPYRPITETASFTAYTENLFGDEEQIELAKFVDDMHRKGAKLVISNSDPKNANENDNFFDDIYSAHRIERVEANRMINCNSEARGKIKELLISNF